MCDPATLAIASMAISTAGALQAHSAQNKAYEKNAEMANKAKMDEDRMINLQQSQEQEAAATQSIEQNRQTQELASRATVAGGESGGFLNNNAVVQDIVRQGLEANTMTGQNLGRTTAQLGEQRLGANTRAQSRINSVSKSSAAATGLQIAGNAANTGAKYYSGGFGDISGGPSSTIDAGSASANYTSDYSNYS